MGTPDVVSVSFVRSWKEPCFPDYATASNSSRYTYPERKSALTCIYRGTRITRTFVHHPTWMLDRMEESVIMEMT